MTNQIERGFYLIIPIIIISFALLSLHLVKVDFILILDVSNLVVNIFLEGRNNFLES